MLEERAEILVNGYWYPFCSDAIKKQVDESSIRYSHLQEEFCAHVFEGYDVCPLRWDRQSIVEFVSQSFLKSILERSQPLFKL